MPARDDETVTGTETGGDDGGETDDERVTCPVCRRARAPAYSQVRTTAPDGTVLVGCVICIDYYEEFGRFPPFATD